MTDRGFRCRTVVEGGESGLCVEHETAKLQIVRPATVLLRSMFDVRKWMPVFRRHGLAFSTGSRRAEAVDAGQREEAAALGIDLFYYRETRGDQPTTGTAVFGTAGVKGVGLRTLWQELSDEGYHLAGLELIPRRAHVSRQSDAERADLLLYFDGDPAHAPPPSESSLRLVSEFFTRTAWAETRVWANPRLCEKGPLHSVVVRGRLHDQQPSRILHFDGGFWGVERRRSS